MPLSLINLSEKVGKFVNIDYLVKLAKCFIPYGLINNNIVLPNQFSGGDKIYFLYYSTEIILL